MNPPQVRQPIREIGKADPAGPTHPSLFHELVSAVTPSPYGGGAIDPEALKGAPPWALALLNTVQNCQAEVALLKLVLERRGLVTDRELLEARKLVDQVFSDQFAQVVNDIERQMNQQPNSPPQDPRGGPRG